MKELGGRVEEGVVFCWRWIVVGHGVPATLPVFNEIKVKVENNKKGAKAKEDGA